MEIEYFYNDQNIFIISNCKTMLEGLEFIRKDFKEIFEAKENANIIILKTENKLEKIQSFESVEFKSKKWLVIAFQSDKRQTVIIWRNQNCNNFHQLKLDEKFSIELSNFLLETIAENINNGILVEIPSNEAAKFLALTFIRDSNGYNLLMKAIENDKFDLFDELMKLPFDLHDKAKTIDDEEVTAADIVWKKKNQEILLKLLENNSPFPNDFKENEASEDIKKFVKVMDEMHSAIENKNKETILKLLQENSKLLYFYSIENYSAVGIAAELEDKSIYCLLIKNGCSIGQFEDYRIILKYIQEDSSFESDLTKGDMKDDYSFQVAPEEHLWYHDHNSKAYFGTLPAERELNNQKRELFRVINESKDGELILKITAYDGRIKTYLDFANDSVMFLFRHIDKNSDLNFGPETTGTFFPKKFNIFIGAKKYDDSKNTIAGILKHEHCHLALLLVFGNSCKPYRTEDEQNHNRFENVVEHCQNLLNQEIIIDWVFDKVFDGQKYIYNYDPSVWHAELAVRVPQMITHYNDDEIKLKSRREIFDQLFKYHEEVIMPAMEQFLFSKIKNEMKFDLLTAEHKSIVLRSFNDISVDKKLNVARKLTSKEIEKVLSRKINQQIFKWYQNYQK
ncbi:hypothetical protein PVAND_016041 [Polypedilum vanderplanki]|uniref:Ankyrin repeat domain-containing protein n=1 Tax=Polypedilum vanderplanki TaxID=319348 RepID=A0A9J6BEZ7_POLVA|nr:hypothetical protein PVAND_016041 [Polypedilum vanderplanki]